MKDHIKTIVIVFIILITYTVLVEIYAANKIKKDDETEEPNVVEPDNPDTNPPETDIKEYSLNLVLFNNQFLGYKDGKWYENPSYEYIDKLFDVYTGDGSYEEKELVYTDKWYLMNSDRSFIDYSGGFVAVNSDKNYNLTFAADDKIDASNKQVIEDFLKSKNITYDYKKLKKSIMTFDVNRDGLHDTIYVISNLFLNDYSGFDSTFAYIFVRTLNQNVVLFEDVYKETGAVSICDPYLYSIISVDDKNSLLFGCEYYSMGGTKFMIYSIDGTTVNKLLETKAN